MKISHQPALSVPPGCSSSWRGLPLPSQPGLEDLSIHHSTGVLPLDIRRIWLCFLSVCFGKGDNSLTVRGLPDKIWKFLTVGSKAAASQSSLMNFSWARHTQWLLLLSHPA